MATRAGGLQAFHASALTSLRMITFWQKKNNCVNKEAVLPLTPTLLGLFCIPTPEEREFSSPKYP